MLDESGDARAQPQRCPNPTRRRLNGVPLRAGKELSRLTQHRSPAAASSAGASVVAATTLTPPIRAKPATRSRRVQAGQSEEEVDEEDAAGVDLGASFFFESESFFGLPSLFEEEPAESSPPPPPARFCLP
ncbi:MAG: hypothetical protein QOJ57_2130 [Thermoleophilaceae bacterium]|nr:hypothetical protein [Thermoleophilaceae bacterium]